MASRRDRTFLVGNFKPTEQPALNCFRDLVRTAYAVEVTPRVGGLIELLWGPMFRDLDLHLFMRRRISSSLKFQDTHIGFKATDGSANEEPWVQWSGDTQASPPGMEQMTFFRWLDAEYDVLVHDYSGIPGFPIGEVSVRIVLPSGEGERLFTARGEIGRWWHVCRIQGLSGRIEEINRVSPECPYSVA